MKQSKSRDPYVYFFSIGLICAIISIAYWPLFQFGLIAYYPRDAHANTMLYGFFWAFVIGFLQTAVPRMTNTLQAKKSEISSGLFLLALQILFNFLNFTLVSRALNFAQIFCLGLFLYRRWRLIKKIPFDGFLFLPFAFICAIAGNLILIFFPEKLFLGYSLVTEGFLLNLIVGIGSRLFPVLQRVADAISPGQASSDSQKKQLQIFFAQALFFNLSFVFYWFSFEKISLIIKLIFIATVAFTNLKFLNKTSVRTYLGLSLKLAIFSILFGYLVSLLLPNSQLINTQHIVFIAGLLLITLMVATRVTLAHGAQNLSIELKAKSLFFISFLFLLAAALRFYAMSDIQSPLLLVASFVFATAVGIWTFKFGKFLWIKDSV